MYPSRLALGGLAFCCSIPLVLGLVQLLLSCPAPSGPAAEHMHGGNTSRAKATTPQNRIRASHRLPPPRTTSDVNFSTHLESYPFYCNPMKQMYVINLQGERGQARRDHATAQFRAAGISEMVQWFPAVDGRHDEELADELGRNCPCDGQLALSLSHRRIYEKMVEEQIPCATIFEDDVILASNFSKRLQRSTINLPPFDVLQLGWCPHGRKVYIPEDQTSVPTIKHGWPGTCMHAYVVSLQGAFLLKWTNTPVRNNADGNMGPARQRKTDHYRKQLSNKPGDLPGSYWHVNPSLAWQAKEIKQGGARRLGWEEGGLRNT